MAKVAFLGLGVMGFPMAGHLVAKGGHEVTVFNRTSSKAKAWAEKFGGRMAPTPKAAAEGQDFVMACVGNDNDLRAITIGADGAFAGMKRGAVFVDHTTASAEVARELDAEATKSGFKFVDAPVSGGQAGAENGVLTVMCGGSEDAFRKAEPILKELGSTVRFIGKAGEAAKVKALVNMVMNINTAGLAEGLALGAALGLDLEMLRKVFSQTGAASRVLETDSEDMQNREHTCFFSAAHAAKDSGIALDLARSLELDFPLARATKEQYDRMIAEGLGELDKSGIAELTFKDRHEHSSDHA